MLGRIGPTELLLILGLVLIVFGPRKLPEIGKAIGKGLKEFRQATREIKESVDINEDLDGASGEDKGQTARETEAGR
ncbi:MAG: Sec-independent protein translocase protein TatAd [Syntrophomonadaceae bacterium]|nr:Sec-independent protein translocase protein TatAd [Bacillota bacterium]